MISKFFNRVISKNNDFFCPFCGRKRVFLDFGNPIRKNVSCSGCGSLERHRFLYYIYKIFFLETDSKIKLLHMAPEKCLYDLLTKKKNIEYTTADIEPGGFDFAKCDKQDFTKMSYKDESFDFILANQVLEHIEDDLRMLSEIRRCLKDDGIFFMNIPYNPQSDFTYEDEKIKSEKERVDAYGQKDHVRLYGNDAQKRFENSGFIVNQIEKNIFPEIFDNYCKFNCGQQLRVDPGGYFILKKKL